MAANMQLEDSHAGIARQYRWLVVLTLPAFLLVAVLERLTARAQGQRTKRGSIFREARETAHTVLPYVFTH